MAAQKQTPSLQDILKRRQRSDFVGREEQITLFRRNLALSLDDNRRRFIFNVAGQGGVGKTWLLRRFRAPIPTAVIMKCNRASTQTKDQSVSPKYCRTYFANPVRSNHVSGIGAR